MQLTSRSLPDELCVTGTQWRSQSTLRDRKRTRNLTKRLLAFAVPRLFTRRRSFSVSRIFRISADSLTECPFNGRWTVLRDLGSGEFILSNGDSLARICCRVVAVERHECRINEPV